ncbi:MAG: hypothetical protein JWR06_418 [Jatrophihabitans sp.]|nr:hypothetical protein [Jatrophihabitans sp.]MDT4903190.1 hypothetical protein [Pseudonocardiales bacterium]
MLGRAWRWIAEQVAFLIVLAGVAAAFVYLLVQPGHWRRGTGALSVALLFAALVRLVLPTARAGMLAVRNRWADTFCYLLLGGLVLAVDIRLRN